MLILRSRDPQLSPGKLWTLVDFLWLKTIDNEHGIYRKVFKTNKRSCVWWNKCTSEEEEQSRRSSRLYAQGDKNYLHPQGFDKFNPLNEKQTLHSFNKLPATYKHSTPPPLRKKSRDRKWLPRKHLIGCRGVKLFLTKDFWSHFEFCQTELNLVPIHVFQFCYN